MTSKDLDYKKICKLHFGTYIHVHEDSNVTNTLEKRTRRSIFLGHTGNLQGNYNFFSIRSGKKITRRKFIEVPTPTIVMKRVTSMALAEKQNEGLIFENCTGATVNDILSDDKANKANKANNKIGGNIAEVDWAEEIQKPAAYLPELNKN